MNKHKFIIKNSKKIIGVIETNDDYWIGTKILHLHGIDMSITKLYTLSIYPSAKVDCCQISVNKTDKAICSCRLYRKL